MFINIHVIQTVPSNNLNRDDTGAPKTLFFGDRERAMLSSQSQKRAVREEFNTKGIHTGVRTKEVIGEVEQSLAKHGQVEDLRKTAVDIIAAMGIIPNKDADKKKYLEENEDGGYEDVPTLVFMSNREIDDAVEAYLKAVDDGEKPGVISKKVKEALNSGHTVDISLFGRMFAGAKDLNVDAACEVAPAMGVGELRQEQDYFTAVDDLKKTSGSSMIGVVGYNSSTLYRYANINYTALKENLGGSMNAAEAVTKFVDAFVKTLPSGKQHAFAARTLPGYVEVTVDEGQPISYANAFLKPVRPEVDSLTGEELSVEDVAIERLQQYEGDVAAAYGVPGRVFTFRVGDKDTTLKNVEEELKSFLEEQDK